MASIFGLELSFTTTEESAEALGDKLDLVHDVATSHPEVYSIDMISEGADKFSVLIGVTAEIENAENGSVKTLVMGLLTNAFENAGLAVHLSNAPVEARMMATIR